MLAKINIQNENRGSRIADGKASRRAVRPFSSSILFLTLALALLISGCTPPGPRALLKGKKYLESGDYAAAVTELKTATALLPTNAQAWNYLGVASQRAGLPDDAVTAYQRALTLDRDLMEAHYNLGSLWLEQNKLAEAKTEFTAYTLRRNNEPDGWLKLGTTQLRASELLAAEKSFSTALYLNTNNAEALNGLGLARVQRGRVREGTQFFSAAIQYHPDYAPALLNLATVAQQDLRDNKLALQNYRAYLALTPRPANWDEVNALANSLEQNPAPATTVAATPPPAVHTTAPAVAEVKTQSVVRPATQSKPVVAKTNPTLPPRQVTSPAPPMAKVKTETVNVAPAEKIVTTPTAQPVVTETKPVVESGATTPEKFTTTGVTPLPPAGSGSATLPLLPPKANASTPATAQPKVIPPAPVTFLRYLYSSPRKPAAGDRVAASAFFSKARVSEQSSRWSEAMEWYRRAAEVDASWFEAQYNYGVLAYRLRNYSAALTADELALAIQPSSADARYNFALALKSAGYPLDAVNELEKILTANPNDVRTQLALGNLYSQQLRNPAKARAHYLKVLALDPHHPSANDIRYWLAANPG